MESVLMLLERANQAMHRLQASIQQRREELNRMIKEQEAEIRNLQIEFYRTEGQYHLLYSLAVENGLIDEQGNVITRKEEQPQEENQ